MSLFSANNHNDALKQLTEVIHLIPFGKLFKSDGALNWNAQQSTSLLILGKQKKLLIRVRANYTKSLMEVNIVLGMEDNLRNNV